MLYWKRSDYYPNTNQWRSYVKHMWRDRKLRFCNGFGLFAASFFCFFSLNPVSRFFNWYWSIDAYTLDTFTNIHAVLSVIQWHSRSFKIGFWLWFWARTPTFINIIVIDFIDMCTNFISQTTTNKNENGKRFFILRLLPDVECWDAEYWTD